MAWQVEGCAALCALAGSTGLSGLLAELSHHFAARHVVSFAGATLCAGVALGLWIPRRVIRQRLSASETTSSAGSADRGVEVEFAASLTGVLMLILAVVWVLLSGLTLGLESYRGVLTQRFLHPPGLTLLLLSGPVTVGLLLLGATGTTVLVALHGWRRLACPTRPAVTRLWVVMLLSTALGGGVAASVTRPDMLVAATLLASFGAGIVAVFRKPAGRVPIEVQPPRAVQSGKTLLLLLMAGVAAAATGVALAASVPAQFMSLRQAAVGVVTLGGASLLGIAIARAVPRVVATACGAPLLLLLIAVAWEGPHWMAALAPLADGLGRLAIVACPAAACVALAGRRVAREHGRAQPAVALVGAAVAVGHGIGLVVAPWWLAAQGHDSVAVLCSVTLTATAVLALILAHDVPRPAQLGGLATCAAWFAVVLLARDAHRPAAGASTAERSTARAAPARLVAREWLATPGLRTAHVQLGEQGVNREATSARDVDLGGPRWDVIVISDTRDAAARALARTAQTDRLLDRCARALLVGGRLVIEWPTAELAAEALCRMPNDPALLLEVTVDDDEYSALIVGRDAPTWLGERPRPPTADIQFHQVQDWVDVEQRLTATTDGAS